MYPDRIGSIIALADDNGAVTNRYKYSPWGESGSMSGTTFGFTGQRFDAETGLYYYKRRYYSPALGRFLQPDPIGNSAGLNIYRYVENDPLNFADPLGLLAGSLSASTGSSCQCACGGNEDPEDPEDPDPQPEESPRGGEPAPPISPTNTTEPEDEGEGEGEGEGESESEDEEGLSEEDQETYGRIKKAKEIEKATNFVKAILDGLITYEDLLYSVL